MVSSKRMIGCKTKKERRNGALRLAAAALAVGVIVPIARVDSLGTMKVYASSAVSTELAAQIAAYTEAAGAQSTGVDPASASVIAATDGSAASSYAAAISPAPADTSVYTSASAADAAVGQVVSADITVTDGDTADGSAYADESLAVQQAEAAAEAAHEKVNDLSAKAEEAAAAAKAAQEAYDKQNADADGNGIADYDDLPADQQLGRITEDVLTNALNASAEAADARNEAALEYQQKLKELDDAKAALQSAMETAQQKEEKEKAAAIAAASENAVPEVTQEEAASTEEAAAEAAEQETATVWEKAGLTKYEYDLLAALVFYEANTESDVGKVAVVNVVLNRIASSSYPGTVEGVIYQRSQFQPARYCGSMAKAESAPASCYAAVDAALSGSNPVGDALHFMRKEYHSGYVIGNHAFW